MPEQPPHAGCIRARCAQAARCRGSARDRAACPVAWIRLAVRSVRHRGGTGGQRTCPRDQQAQRQRGNCERRRVGREGGGRARGGDKHAAEHRSQQGAELDRSRVQRVPGLQLGRVEHARHDRERGGQEEPLAQAEQRRHRGERRERGNVPRHEPGEHRHQHAANHVGGQHHGPWPDLVRQDAAERYPRGARHAITGQHGAKQHRAAALGQHQPGQRDGVAEVADRGRELPGGEQPEIAVRQRAAPPPGPNPVHGRHHSSAGSNQGSRSTTACTRCAPAGRSARSSRRYRANRACSSARTVGSSSAVTCSTS